MSEKKSEQTTENGAVELTEASLDDASGGILIGLNKAIKFDTTIIKLGDGSVKPTITDGTSNIFKF
ncbi:MAG: hypothetical protein IPN84_11955 [Sphingomonadales bacterium]|jgi:hypothetical protein|nr:hypothetical protein [Sphingomonadales bacterium]